jgi:hypothetical protein
MRKFLAVVTISALMFILLLIFVILDSDLGHDFYLKKSVKVKEGSYTGRVVDAETGEPIEGAAVYMGWWSRKKLNFLEGLARLESHSEYYYIGEVLAFTDLYGRYKVPTEMLSRRLHWRTKRPDARVLIYKKGYVAYNNEIVFDGHKLFVVEKPEGHFQRRGNLVNLRPWEDDFSHRQHFYFISSSFKGSKYKAQKEIVDLARWEALLE